MNDLNLVSIYTANLLGIMLAMTLLIGNGWRWKRNDKENSLLVFMLILVGITCITEPTAFVLDGHPGKNVRTIIYAVDTWTYSSNLLAAATWLVFLATHLKGNISKGHVMIINVLVAAGLLTLFVNLFTPVVFHINENNVYNRLPMYYVYMAIDMFMLLDSLITYIYIRIKGRRLKFFFFWVYTIPIIAGCIVQTRYYGLSMIAPCMMISLAGLMSTVQNEMIFKDKLTGLYNRYYLDQLETELKHDRNAEYTFIMLDINDFKSINDNFGHLMGDHAISDTAQILKRAVGSSGIAIRYAGDEFIVVLSTRTQIDTDIFVANIRKGFDEFNNRSKRSYKLNASMGYSVVNLKDMTMDEIMNRIDKLMYEDKTRYYQSNASSGRRRGDRE